MTSRWLPEGFKMAQIWPRKGPRRAEDGRQDDQLVQEGFRWFQGGPGGPQDGPRGLQGDPQEPPGGPRVAPRWHKEGPRRPQDSPKRAQDEAKMAQHGAPDSKLKPKGRNIKNLEQPQENQCFFEDPGTPGRPITRPRWFQVNFKLGYDGLRKLTVGMR